MKSVAIVGVGLIGGSFGLALRKAGFTGEIIGVSSTSVLEAALKRDAISATATLEQAVASADLVYLAQPVDRILETLQALAPLAQPESLITDAGSTKTAIVQKAAECLPASSFIGGHPLAGREQRGVEAADPDLFRERPYVLTPTTPETPAHAVFQAWLRRMGARVIHMSAFDHDQTVAFTSHLPQLLSTALALTLAEQSKPAFNQIFGSGLLDMTRLALSAPDLWASILATNQADVVTAIDALLASMTRLKGALATPELHVLFDSAASFALRIRKVSCNE